MTDNIFESETAAIALRTCFSEDPGILVASLSHCNSFFEEFRPNPLQVSIMLALLEGTLR